MASAKKKRAADTYLTDQNWNQEDDSEEQEAGTFESADDKILAGRTFKKARRRGNDLPTTSEDDEPKTKNPFSGFGGFGSGAPIPSTSFPIKPPAPKTEDDNTDFWGKSDKKVDFFASRGENKENTETKPATAIEENNNVKKDEKFEWNDDAEYFKQLCALNLSVLDWIKEHVNKNPCIDLSPVFKDYENHMKDLDKNRSAEKSKTKTSNNTPEVSHTKFAITKPVFASSTPIVKDGMTAPPPTVPKFGANFFSPAPAAPVATTTAAESEEKDQPPQPEVKTIVEEDAFHQLRCKLFFKKGAQWQELGKGMLYLKRASKDAKVQLLIRMEAVTGKILLNVSVSVDTPLSRSGKNNLMLVTVPNPPVFTKPAEGDNSLPCTYLIRVKGTPEADELLAKIKE